MSACVLPIAPEFQDPPTSSNYAPFFVAGTVDPALGAIVTTPKFDVVVQDPNVGDDLYYRWIADYPPYSDNTRILGEESTKISHTADGMPLQAEITKKPDCIANTLARLPSHQIMLVVSDRDFLPAQSMAGQMVDYTRVPPEAREVIGTWTLQMECKGP